MIDIPVLIKNKLPLKDEAECNFIQILKLLKNNYQYGYYNIGNQKAMFSGIFREKNNTLYIFKFIKYHRQHHIPLDLRNKINIPFNIKFINKKQYIRIIKYFSQKCIFTLENYLITNFNRHLVTNIEINPNTDISQYNFTDEEQNIIKILQYSNIKCKYASNRISIDSKKWMYTRLYIPADNTYYFIERNLLANQLNYLQQNINNFGVRIIIIDNQQYLDLLNMYKDKLKFINIRYCKTCNSIILKPKYFCSDKCNKYYNDNKIYTLTCKVCGKQFTSHNKRKQICSSQCLAKRNLTVKNTKSHSSIYYSGYYMDIHHFVRSSWEHNVARILQYCKLDYDYEEYTFDLSDGTTYTPDFYVYADNTFYEVKGEWTQKSRHKVELFRKDYPDKKLIVIDYYVYKQLLKQFSNINFKLHVIAEDTRLRNITKYRHDNIYYEDWELDNRFYTNRVYDNLNQYITYDEALVELGITKTALTQMVNSGRIKYGINNDVIIFKPNEIEFLKLMLSMKNKQPVYYRVLNNNTHSRLQKTCECCGQVFKAIRPNKKYCSNKCKDKVARMHKARLVKCASCGKVYKSERKKNIYFCKECGIIYAHMKKTGEETSIKEIMNNNLNKIYWKSGDHISFINEAEDNFAKILEALGNEYKYENDYCIVNKTIYKFPFYRIKNQCIYILQFAYDGHTNVVIREVLKRVKQYNLHIHIIDKKKYYRILQWFILHHHMNFKTEVYTNMHFLKPCEICGQPTYNQYCSNKCLKKAFNDRVRDHKIANAKFSSIENTIIVNMSSHEKTRLLHQNITNNLLDRNKLNLHFIPCLGIYQGSNIVNLNDIKINRYDKQYLQILIINNIEFKYETDTIMLDNGKVFIPKILLNNGIYYFIKFAYCPSYRKKIEQFQKNVDKVCIIGKRRFKQLLQIYHIHE